MWSSLVTEMGAAGRKADWKVFKISGTQEEGITETTLPRNLAVRGVERWGESLGQKCWAEYKFTQISMGLFLAN